MRCFVLLMLCLVVLGCEKEVGSQTGVPIPNNLVPEPPLANTWLALGDSYTIGQGVEADERFPAQAAVLLARKNIRIDTLTYLATTGWTTLDLQQALNSTQPKKHKIVSLLIGVNDQYRRWDSGGYRVRFRELLIKAIDLARGRNDHVWVLSIPDYAVTPYARFMDTARISREIDQFNRINRSVTAYFKCHYIDITGFTREGRFNPLLISEDGLHPSAIDYRRWAELLVTELVTQLN